MPRRTPSGKKTAVADVEDKLAARYGKGDPRVYATLNKIGLMQGSKVTAKARRRPRVSDDPTRQSRRSFLVLGELMKQSCLMTRVQCVRCI